MCFLFLFLLVSCIEGSLQSAHKVPFLGFGRIYKGFCHYYATAFGLPIGYESTTHGVVLHFPKPPYRYGVAPSVCYRSDGSGSHIHSFLLSENVSSHHTVALLAEIALANAVQTDINHT